MRTFDNCESLEQTIKNSSLYLFLDWVRLYIGDGSLSLLDCVDWLSPKLPCLTTMNKDVVRRFVIFFTKIASINHRPTPPH